MKNFLLSALAVAVSLVAVLTPVTASADQKPQVSANELAVSIEALGSTLVYSDTDVDRPTVTLGGCVSSWTVVGTDDYEATCISTGGDDCEIAWQVIGLPNVYTWSAACGEDYLYKLFFKGGAWNIEIYAL